MSVKVSMLQNVGFQKRNPVVSHASNMRQAHVSMMCKFASTTAIRIVLK